MRFWRYGMVRKDFSPSAIRRSMSRRHASEVVKKPPKEFITLKAARLFCVASSSLALAAVVISESMLSHQRHLNDKKYMEYMEDIERRLNES